LYNFQKDGIKFGVQKFGRLLLGDEMGIGKTVQAIGIAWLYRDAWPLLVIAPSSLKYQWRDEFIRWIPELRMRDIQLLQSARDCFLPHTQVFITSYDIATRISSRLLAFRFNASIADEAHYLKNYDT